MAGATFLEQEFYLCVAHFLRLINNEKKPKKTKQVIAPHHTTAAPQSCTDTQKPPNNISKWQAVDFANSGANKSAIARLFAPEFAPKE